MPLVGPCWNQLAGELSICFGRAFETVFAQSSIEMQHSTRFLSQKIAPLKIKTTPLSPKRINILIPTIDLNLLFGGYIGKLNLAKRFIDCGYDVRMIIVDECNFLPFTPNGTLPSSIPLAAELSKIKFQYCYYRDNSVVKPHINLRDANVELDGQIVVGKFVDVERPYLPNL